MMKESQKYILLFLMLAVLMGCKEEDDAVVSDVTADLAFSVSASAHRSSRMAANVIQQTDATYRGINELYVIPFAVRDRKIQRGDIAKRDRIGGIELEYPRTNAWFYYYQKCHFMRGVASFLVYGKAAPYGSGLTETEQKLTNGSLDAVFPLDMNLEGVSFTPTAIYGSTVPHTQAAALAAYLTAIANVSVTRAGTTTAWKNVLNPELKALFQNFIGQQNTATVDIPGSSANVLVFVNELYARLMEPEFNYEDGTLEKDLRDAIRNRIANYAGVTFESGQGKVTSLGTAMSGFPASIGLPDGAAAVRWTGEAFEPQTQTTTLDNVTSIDRYAYPAELYYFSNSLIATSSVDDRKTSYTGGSAKATWAEVLADYEHNPGVVGPNTKAVAIKDPMQYGVAHLQVKLKQVAASLADADGADADIAVGTTTFPLTAILVANQHPVGFDFKPQSTTVDEYCIYDSQVPTGGSTIYLSTSVAESELIHTLVLQNKDDEEVAVVLEFLNNGTQTFEGVNGLVYPGTKFYLVAKVKPETVAATAEDYKKRVFTQDHVTTMGMKVESLAKAYNVLPNLRSPRLEIGVQVITDWMQAETTNVMLE